MHPKVPMDTFDEKKVHFYNFLISYRMSCISRFVLHSAPVLLQHYGGWVKEPGNQAVQLQRFVKKERHVLRARRPWIMAWNFLSPRRTLRNQHYFFKENSQCYLTVDNDSFIRGFLWLTNTFGTNTNTEVHWCPNWIWKETSDLKELTLYQNSI